MSDTPESAAEALLEAEGFTVTPPAPVAPATATASLWKPRKQEFFEKDFDALAAEIPQAKLIKYTHAEQDQDGVVGHVLIATQEL